MTGALRHRCHFCELYPRSVGSWFACVSSRANPRGLAKVIQVRSGRSQLVQVFTTIHLTAPHLAIRTHCRVACARNSVLRLGSLVQACSARTELEILHIDLFLPFDRTFAFELPDTAAAAKSGRPVRHLNIQRLKAAYAVEHAQRVYKYLAYSTEHGLNPAEQRSLGSPPSSPARSWQAAFAHSALRAPCSLTNYPNCDFAYSYRATWHQWCRADHVWGHRPSLSP